MITDAPSVAPEATDPADAYADAPRDPNRPRRARWVMLALLALVVAVGLTWALTRGDSSDAVAEALNASL